MISSGDAIRTGGRHRDRLRRRDEDGRAAREAGAAAADPQPPPVATKPAPPPVTAEAFCKRALELKAANCGMFAGAAIPATCVDEAKAELAKSAQLRALGRCLVDHNSCEEVTGCIGAIDADELHDSSELRACTDPSDERPVGVPRAEYDKRNGVGVTKFSQVKSTKERPVEMCGIGAGNKWLASLACDDGSRPLHGNSEAERSRVGNVGPGGRCGSIVDHYKVTCGDKAYDIFTDGYVCPLEQ